VECIGKGKAHRPYEFGVKVSFATTVKHAAGGPKFVFFTDDSEQQRGGRPDSEASFIP
jgi:hypothetical protein